MPKKTLLAWSTGKDSAYALWLLRQDPSVEVVGLLTTLNSVVRRVNMHGVSEQVLEAQAASCGLPLHRVLLPDPCGDEDYRAAMSRAVAEARAGGVQAMAFGDLFLADVRKYREEQLTGSGVEPLFPLWGRSTARLAHEMVAAGLEAVLTCVDTERLDRSFVGRRFGGDLLADLPARVDPCGENGEFHTAVIGGPMFERPLPVELGEVVERGRFVFVDLLLHSQG